MVEPTEGDESKSWLVQELPSVGWVIKPAAGGEGSGDVELGASNVVSPSRKPEGPQAPDSEPVPLLTVPAGTGMSLDPRTNSEAESEPISLPHTIASPSAPQPSLRGSKQSPDDGPRAAGQAGSADTRAKALTRRSSGFDAFVIYALESGPAAKTGAGRATAISRGLKDRGLRICTQSFLAGAVKQHLSSSDEAHFMAQAAQNSDCAVILLTRQFIERVESGVFGDSCVAAFTLAKRLPNAIMAALEPDLANPNAWGWNQVFARFSGRAVVDLSMRESDPAWQDAVDRLAWLLNPQLELTRSAMCTASGTGPPLSAEPAPERSDTGLAKRGYDCFISHNWGKDSQGRDNHQRVMQIASSLQSHGIQVFLQDWEAHRYSSTDEAMVDGMQRSSVALIFVTRSYIQKIEDGKVDDDCVAQFNLAKRAPAILPVVLEPELVKTGKWGWNRVYAHLSGKMIVDLSRGEVMGFPAVLASGSGQRMQSQLDLLELRILQEAHRLHPKLMQAKPPPLVPHKDVVMISAVCLSAGALLHVAVVSGQIALEGTLNFFFRLLATISAFLWLVGFALYTMWLVMKARQPPSFDLSPALLQPLALLGNACRAIAWALFLMRHVMVLSGVEDIEANAAAMLNGTSANSTTQDFGWATHVGTYGFSFACLVCLLDAWFVSSSCPGSFQERSFSANSLGGWAWVSMFLASICMALSTMTMQTWSDAAPLEIIAALLLFLGAALLLLWLLLHPKQLRRHLEILAAGEPAVATPMRALGIGPEFPSVPLQGPPLFTQAPELEPAAESPANASAPVQGIVLKAPEPSPPAESSANAAPMQGIVLKAPEPTQPVANGTVLGPAAVEKETPKPAESPTAPSPAAEIAEEASPTNSAPGEEQTDTPSSAALEAKPKAKGYKRRVVSSLLKAAKDGSLGTSLQEFEAKETSNMDAQEVPESPTPAGAAPVKEESALPLEPKQLEADPQSAAEESSTPAVQEAEAAAATN